MPTLEESLERVAAYYKAIAPIFHEGAGYSQARVNEAYEPLKAMYRSAFAKRDVLELACGSGFWSEVVVGVANTLLSTDLHEEQVEITSKRLGHLSSFRCQTANAYTLDTVEGSFSGAFGSYWWSHVPRKLQKSFLNTLHSRLRPGAQVMFSDNMPYYGETVKRRVDEHGDIYEERVERDDDFRFETIKNFPRENEFAELLDGIVDDLRYTELSLPHIHKLSTELWVVSYRLKQ